MKRCNELYFDEIQRDRYESLCSMLSDYESKGVRVFVQGKRYPVQKSAEIMSVNESDCFMPDIIIDNFGKVVEVNYDKIVHV